MRSLSLALLFALVGCRDSGDNGDTPDARRGDGGDMGGMTIQEIQTPPGPGIGSPVELHGVVVTAVDRYGARQGLFWVQEPSGGEFSGVAVFTGNTSAVAGLEPGDLVSITGAVVDEFALMEDTTGRKVTEVADPTGGMMTITETGAGALPAPMVLDPRMLADDDTESDYAERWEGVLITIEDVAVTQRPESVSDTDPTLKEMGVTGPFRVGSGLAELSDSIALGDCYGSMTGVVDYFFSYKLQHRSAADLTTGGTCAPQEEGDTACGNTTDDDADGFADCADFSCQATVAACTMETTISAIQGEDVPLNTRVRLSNVIVAAKSDEFVWVQTGAVPAPNEGIAIFFPPSVSIPASVMPGDNVTLEGTVEEFYMRTNLRIALDASSMPILTENSSGAAPVPLIVDSDVLSAPSTAEPYEGVLVQVNLVSVVSANPDAPSDFGEWTVGTASMPVRIGNDISERPAGVAAGQCYTVIAGPFDYSFSNYKIEATTLTAGAGCP